MIYGFDNIKSKILAGEFKGLYLDMIGRHLEYLGVSDINVEKYKDSYHLPDLDKEIQERVSHMIPFSLMSSILGYATGGAVDEIEEETLKERLSKPGITSPSVINLITPNSEVLNPVDFKSKLYPPQAAVLKRMLDFEPVRKVNFREDYYIRCGVVSERIGFGKTYLCAALLAHRPFISMKAPEDLSCKVLESYMPNANRTLFEDSYKLKMNIVICNLKTARDWETNIRNLTNLSVMKITSKKMLQTFIDCYNKQEIPDVLVVKDGKIDGSVLVETLVGILGDKVSTRVIIDDYDVLNIDKNISLPTASFYWFISSTREFGNKKPGKWSSNDSDSFSIARMERNMPVFDMFSNIKCIDGFLSREYNIPKIDLFSRNTNISKLLCDKCIGYEEATMRWEEHLQMSPICKDYDNPPCDICEKYISIMDEKYPDDIDTMHRCKGCRNAFYKGVMESLKSDIVDFVKGKGTFERIEHPKYFIRLLQGTVDVPPVDARVKALVLAKEFSDTWSVDGLRTVVISSNNIREFETSDDVLGICGNLSGINLKYLTHMIVLPGTSPDSVLQFVGRGQRLGRTQNLQVLFA